MPRPEDVPLGDSADDLDDPIDEGDAFPKRRLAGKQSGEPARAVRRRLDVIAYAEALAACAPEASKVASEDYVLDPSVPADLVNVLAVTVV